MKRVLNLCDEKIDNPGELALQKKASDGSSAEKKNDSETQHNIMREFIKNNFMKFHNNNVYIYNGLYYELVRGKKIA